MQQRRDICFKKYCLGSEVQAGGPRWLHLPEGPAATPAGAAAPWGARPRGVRYFSQRKK